MKYEDWFPSFDFHLSFAVFITAPVAHESSADHFLPGVISNDKM